MRASVQFSSVLHLRARECPYALYLVRICHAGPFAFWSVRLVLHKKIQGCGFYAGRSTPASQPFHFPASFSQSRVSMTNTIESVCTTTRQEQLKRGWRGREVVGTGYSTNELDLRISAQTHFRTGQTLAATAARSQLVRRLPV